MSHKRPDLTKVYAPPGANTTIPENLPPPGVMSPGLVKNLKDQVMSIYKHCNEKSFKTRVRYLEAANHFCCFLAVRFRLEKFKNVDDRHFRAYAEYLKAIGASPATIQAELAGIRFFYRLSGGKNKLSENSSLNLPKRAVGTENRAWLPEEKEKAVAIAERMGRTDVVIAIDLAYELGLRVEEICVTRVEYLISARNTGIFVVPKGKGGQRRAIKLNPVQRAMICKYLDYAKAMGLQPGDYLISGSEKHGVKMEIKSLQKWMISLIACSVASSGVARGPALMYFNLYGFSSWFSGCFTILETRFAMVPVNHTRMRVLIRLKSVWSIERP